MSRAVTGLLVSRGAFALPGWVASVVAHAELRTAELPTWRFVAGSMLVDLGH